MRGVAYFFLAACVGVLGSCKRSPAPPAPAANKPIVVSVGGLGSSRMGAFNATVTADIPAITLADFGTPDAWKADIAGWLNANPHSDRIVLCGHSYGAQKVAEASASVGTVALVILFDPVNPVGKETAIPPNVARCIVFRRSNWDIERMATVTGEHEEFILPNTSHNSVPSDPVALMVSVAAINEVLK